MLLNILSLCLFYNKMLTFLCYQLLSNVNNCYHSKERENITYLI